MDFTTGSGPYAKPPTAGKSAGSLPTNKAGRKTRRASLLRWSVVCGLIRARDLAGRRVTYDWPLIPFSSGDAECAGRNLVLRVTGSLLAALVDGRWLRRAHRRPLHPGSHTAVDAQPVRLRFDLAL
jgi:hypothetical protein